jgi:phosphoglycolate phosphatase
MTGIKLIITDLDNTIYNWVDFYGPAFRAMLLELVRITGLDEEVLKASFKRVHQRHHTSEYSFAIEELDVLSDRDRGLSVAARLQKYGPAIEAFRRKRDETLKPYPGVAETLTQLRAQGKQIVGHTDAMKFYAVYRLQRQLRMADLFDGLFSIRDHGLPPGVVESDVRSQSDPAVYKCSIPVQREFEPTLTKPDPRALNSILKEFCASPQNALYVGDSAQKDLRMAQECGVRDVLAAYGREYNPRNWQLLVDITHWTDEDLARERQLGSQKVKPTYTISEFPELLSVVRDIEGCGI